MTPLGRFQIWKMTSGAGGQGWFQGNRCLQWAPSLGRYFPSPNAQPPSFLLRHCVTNQEGAHLSFLTYPCHLSGREKLLVRNFGLASPGRCSLKQTPQRQLSSLPASKQKLACGNCLHHCKEVPVTFLHPCFWVLENLTRSSVQTGSPCFLLSGEQINL